MIFGLVLAGGRSRRFGREKAMAEFLGRPMISHVATVLAADCDRVAINAAHCSGAAAFAREHGLDHLPDAPSDPDGPLAGIRAGLDWAKAGGAEVLATAPCDTPLLPSDLVKRLEAARRHGCAAVACTAEGIQPLCALWPVGSNVVADILSTDRHPPVKQLLKQLGAIAQHFREGWRFDNLNTPEDFQTAALRAEGARAASRPPK